MSKQWNISKQTGHGPTNNSKGFVVHVEEKINLPPKPLAA
jgi:hypothetical protein